MFFLSAEPATLSCPLLSLYGTNAAFFSSFLSLLDYKVHRLNVLPRWFAAAFALHRLSGVQKTAALESAGSVGVKTDCTD